MLTSERPPDPDSLQRARARKVWLWATGLVILVLGAFLAVLLFLGVGGMAPAWGLLLYMPFVFIGMAALKFISQGFRVRRRPVR